MPPAEARPRGGGLEVDGEAGGGALDAFEGLEVLGDGFAEFVEVVGFELDDDVVGAGDGVDGGDGGEGGGDVSDGVADGLGASDFGFDEDVATDGHGGWLLDVGVRTGTSGGPFCPHEPADAPAARLVWTGIVRVWGVGCQRSMVTC